MSLPDDLDPRTLRWVADQLDSEALEAGLVATDFEAWAAGTASRASWRQRARTLRAKRRWLRQIATRIERRREPRG